MYITAYHLSTMTIKAPSPSLYAAAYRAILLLLLISQKASAYSGTITKNIAVPSLQNGMDYCKLGTSDLEVSKVCMGTMTFGNQNTLSEGVEQLNIAFDNYGINFIDTAELYPVPGSPDVSLCVRSKTRSKSTSLL